MGGHHHHHHQQARGHGHAHYHTAGASARRLSIALVLTGTVLVAEVVAGLLFNSLALLSDAAHMFTDAAALAIALLAIRLGARPADAKRTFGYRRLEVLAAAVNAVMLFIAGAYILVEAVRRLLAPEPVASTGMLVVAVLGLVVNLIAMRLLAGGRHESLNVRGANLEVLADAVGSAGVIAGALLIRFTGWSWVDPLIAVAIALWVAPRAWMLLRDAGNILMEGAPRGVALAEVRAAIAATPGVAGLHDLHVWVSGADQPSGSAHLELAPEADADAVRAAVSERLRRDFGLGHLTLQTEREPCVADGVLHA